MSKSDFPSAVTVAGPGKGCTVFDFLRRRFTKISQDVWRERIESGSVTYEHGIPVKINDAAIPGTKIIYYREVENEKIIPFKEKILFINEHILVADKPHFLQVAPAGQFADETLLNRLKKSTGLKDIVPVNRLDRSTAGIVLFSVNKNSRDAYYNIFRKRLIHKTYKGISAGKPDMKETRWRIENRLVQGEPWFRMKPSDGSINAVSDIILDKYKDSLCYFSIYPETGQKHQLRIHMSMLGFPILNDKFYPVLFPEEEEDFSKPLKLLAEKISFKDPVTGAEFEFRTEQEL